MQRELEYLAVPYTHDDADIMLYRFNAVNKVAAQLIREGRFIFSPISHTHPIAEHGDIPRSWDYWNTYDRVILSFCKKLVVLCLPGWEQSIGVQAEIKIAEELGLEIEYIVLSH